MAFGFFVDLVVGVIFLLFAFGAGVVSCRREQLVAVSQIFWLLLGVHSESSSSLPMILNLNP
jgi:hypothetical protein